SVRVRVIWVQVPLVILREAGLLDACDSRHHCAQTVRELPMFAPRIRSPLDLIEEEGRRGARAGRRIGCRLLWRDSSAAVRQIASGAEPFRRSRYRRRKVQAKVVEVLLIGTTDTLALRVDQRRWIRSEERRSDREIGASDSEAQVDGVGTLWSWPI